METEGLRSRLDEQEVSGRLSLDVRLRGGIPAEMDFDISGSSLLLVDFTVKGGRKGFDVAGWQARFDLSEARAVWKKPARLDLAAEIEMADSRPIVAMFANQRGKEGWLDRILKVGTSRAMVVCRSTAAAPWCPTPWSVASASIEAGPECRLAY
jgi:hypothetical protein